MVNGARGLWQSLLLSCEGGEGRRGEQVALAKVICTLHWLYMFKENINSGTQGQLSVPVFIILKPKVLIIYIF